LLDTQPRHRSIGAPAFTRLWMLILWHQLGDEWCVAMADRVSGTALQWIKRDERTAFRSRGFISLRALIAG
jgi:hypothetical protein